MTTTNKKIFILYSGRGTNAWNLFDAIINEKFPADVCGIDKGNYKDCEDRLLQKINIAEPDIICLAGYMHILSEWFLEQVTPHVLNIHPSDLPKYKGLNTHARVLEDKETQTGCTVHLVTKELDGGKIIQQTLVGVDDMDTVDSLAARVLRAEHKLYPAALKKFIKQLDK